MSYEVMQRMMFALSALVFHVTLCIVLVMVGNPATQAAAMLALFFAGLSQFIAQDNRQWVLGVAMLFTWVSLCFIVVGFAIFVFSF